MNNKFHQKKREVTKIYFSMQYREIYFCLEFLVMQKRRLDYKNKNKFKIYGVTTWETNNCNTHIVQYLEKQRQSDNGI